MIPPDLAYSKTIDSSKRLFNNIPIPNPAQLAWQEAELGLLFSYDLHVFDGKRYQQPINRTTPISDYNIFSPESLDTDQWITAAKAMGARFALITATHETGFALYQSDVNPYCLKAVKWQEGKGDIVRDFVNSCRRYGIEPGIYIGIRWNSFYGVYDFQVDGQGTFGQNRQIQYRRMAEGMVEELCSRYGPLFEIWFDGGADHPDRGAPDVLPIVKRYQPKALFYHNAQLAEARWGGSESGTVPYPCWATFPYPSTDGKTYPKILDNNFDLLKTGDPNGSYWMPAMSDAPLRGYKGCHEWFWEPGDEGHIYPLKQLMNIYNKSVGCNSTLILGITPDPKGLVPEPDTKRMREFGQEIGRIFNKPIASVSGQQNDLNLEFSDSTQIDLIVLQEDIQYGERVREFIIQNYSNGKWQDISSGSCIGHKRIIQINPLKIKKIRLKILASVNQPLIKRFAVYNSWR